MADPAAMLQALTLIATGQGPSVAPFFSDRALAQNALLEKPKPLYKLTTGMVPLASAEHNQETKSE